MIGEYFSETAISWVVMSCLQRNHHINRAITIFKKKITIITVSRIKKKKIKKMFLEETERTKSEQIRKKIAKNQNE